MLKNKENFSDKQSGGHISLVPRGAAEAAVATQLPYYVVSIPLVMLKLINVIVCLVYNRLVQKPVWRDQLVNINSQCLKNKLKLVASMSAHAKENKVTTD